MSWNTVRPGMSVFSRNTGPYRMISAPQYALFHTVVDLEALPSTQDVKCDDVGNWRNNSNEKSYFNVEWMDENSAQVTAAESSDPDVATLKREYYMLKHDNDLKEDRYPFP